VLPLGKRKKVVVPHRVGAISRLTSMTQQRVKPVGLGRKEDVLRILLVEGVFTLLSKKGFCFAMLNVVKLSECRLKEA